MKRHLLSIAAGLAALATPTAEACTNFIVTRGASTDGSVMVTYAADSHQLYGALYKYNAPRKNYPAGTMLTVTEWDTGKVLGQIPQAAVTYSTIGNMNEHGVIIGETTYGGLAELGDANGIMDYGSLIYIGLQRARTAREAIEVIAALASEHGYASSGESFSVADPDEAWIMELQSKGKYGKGIVWVARRIPDGMVSGHANHPRITQFPKNDPENCLYSPDVISFARERGYYNGSDDDVSFSDTYAPLDFGAARGCEARVWSFFRAVADGMDVYTDYAMGYDLSKRMPLWVAPREKISPKQVFDLMRDHYEGTPMDMTRDIGAGGHNLPYRWRPMDWTVEDNAPADAQHYLNERATATQQTGFWFVGQSRNWLPAPVAGILWFGTDDAATSPLTPIYSSSTSVPWCFSTENGHMTEYSPTSMFWLTNRVTNFAYMRYDMISADIRKVLDKWENERLGKVSQTDAAAAELYAKKPAKALEYLTAYSVNTAQTLFQLWDELDKYLLVKYMDGNVKKENDTGGFGGEGFLDNGNGANIPASPDFPGYDERWRRNVVANDDGTLKSR
jgi:dipeptidase